MKRFSRIAAVLVVAAAPALALPGAALAQNSPENGQGNGTMQPGQRNNHEAMVAAHIAELHAKLKITPAEESQWAVFAHVMRENARAMDEAFAERGQKLQSMNAVQDLDSYARISEIQSSNMQKLAGAFATLYATFPPQQQKLADEVFRQHALRHHTHQ